VPPYSDEQGGFVCNIAIDRYAVATVGAAPHSGDDADSMLSKAESALANAALRRARRGGTDTSLSLHLNSNFPVGAGMGGSSAAGVASLGALHAWRGESLGRSEIAELSRQVEVEDLGVPGGRQDHYAAAYGGALALTFARSGVSVERISLSSALREEIERRFLVIYTGKSRISGDTITAVLDGYKSRTASVCSALDRMRGLARLMAVFLKQGAIDDLGMALQEHWVHQRSLHQRISTSQIDLIMDVALRSGAIGGKALGASGGGSMVLVARSGTEDALRCAIQGLGEIIPFRIDDEGLVVRESSNAGRSW
jgi:D-glycero-alpha-D-manno-heptose-7-phosphate kinase